MLRNVAGELARKARRYAASTDRPLTRFATVLATPPTIQCRHIGSLRRTGAAWAVIGPAFAPSS